MARPPNPAAVPEVFRVPPDAAPTHAAQIATRRLLKFTWIFA